MILRSYLNEGYLHEFWDLFTEHYTNRKLIVVSERLREENLKKNVFQGLMLNIEWKEN